MDERKFFEAMAHVRRLSNPQAHTFKGACPDGVASDQRDYDCPACVDLLSAARFAGELESEDNPDRLIVDVTWRCPQCGKAHPTRVAAEECLARGFNPTLKVGDIVVREYHLDKKHHNYGWFDGDEAWLYSKKKSGSGKDHTPSGYLYSFFYVVTFIDGDHKDRHRPRYHVFTAAMSGEQGHHRGYTFDVDHVKMAVVTKNIPEAVFVGSKEFVGKMAKSLL